MKKRPRLVVLAIAALASALPALATDLTVTVKSSRVRADALFFAPTVASVTEGDRLGEVSRKGDWIQVEIDSDMTGWIHVSAVTDRKVELGTGSRTVSSTTADDEITLAGKGFNEDLESRYRQGRSGLDYDEVDALETSSFDDDQLYAFFDEGKLALAPEPAQAETAAVDRPKKKKKKWRFGSKLRKLGGELAEEAGVISKSERESIDETSEAFRRSFDDLSEKEEYFLGRAVAATILSSTDLHPDRGLHEYVNKVGLLVAAGSDRPELYGGYHFAVLDSTEINAMAAPGGFVFVSRGMLGTLASEEELAGVLAHEIAHVSAKHGLAAIKKSRLVEAFSILGREASASGSSEDLAKLTDLFEGAVGDIVKTVIEKGHDRTNEAEADEMAVDFATRLGYAADGLSSYLGRLDRLETDSGKLALLRTHPEAASRLDGIVSVTERHRSRSTDPSPRAARFRQVLANE